MRNLSMSQSLLTHSVVVFLVVVVFWGYPTAYAANKLVQIKMERGDKLHNSILDKSKKLAFGGFTPSYRPNHEMIKGLAAEGFFSMRLINVEWGNRVTTSGNLKKVAWSRKFQRELEKCKQLGLRPHVIVGQIVPDGLQEIGERNERRGVKDWGIYRQYIHALLDYVLRDWGFKEVVLEVGNEMDNPKFNWVPVRPLRSRLDLQGYRFYFKLFTEISRAVSEYREKNPGANLFLGGPALTQNSMNFPSSSDKNWLARFAYDVVSQEVPIDFFSMHFYGSAGSRSELQRRIEVLNEKFQAAGRSLPIWITEWGTSAFFQYENENFLPDAGAFSLDFLNTIANAGVENALFIAATQHSDSRKSGPALLLRTGEKAHAYRAISILSSLAGNQISCESNNSDVSCIAVENGGDIEILLWHSDWSRRRMGDREWLARRERGELEVSFRIPGPDAGAGDLFLVQGWNKRDRGVPSKVGRFEPDRAYQVLKESTYVHLRYKPREP